MAEAERILAALGAVPKGAMPKTILAGDENQEPGYYQTDPLSNLVRVLKKQQIDIQDRLQKRQETFQKRVDMYKTLREAGYSKESAHEAVIKNDLSKPVGDEDPIKKTSREKILDKIARGDTLSEGEQKLYDETIKHKESDLSSLFGEEDVQPSGFDKTRQDIEDKVARGTPLAPGEQKIYDDVIAKRKPSSSEEMVPVISPDGKTGSIPKSKLAAALKKGYKQR